MKELRIKEIEDYIMANNVCSVDKLCEVFGVSKTTMRRDINILLQEGLIKKVYGGIALNSKDSSVTVPFDKRQVSNLVRKKRIGRIASTLVNDGDTVYIDSGTTTLCILDYIKTKNIDIITNSLKVLEECENYANLNVISTGGQLNRRTYSFIGESAVNTLRLYNISRAFMAATGASVEAGVSNSLQFETAIKKVVLERSGASYVCIDHSKWDVVSLATYAPLDGVTGIITDESPPERYVSFFENTNVKIMYE